MAFGLAALYLAIMSGHMSSMDGLYMERQAYALAIQHSIRFQTPVWTWRSEPTWNSNYGIGLSLLYLPGMMAAAAFGSHPPIAVEHPPDTFAFYLRELYQDGLYAAGASWVHVVIVALAAYLVGRLIVALGFSVRAGLWGMAFYGLGSSALVYARGDFAQPLEGLCWTAALLTAVNFRTTGKRSALALACVAVSYAILTRPVEGLMLVPAVMVVALSDRALRDRRTLTSTPLIPLVVATLFGVAVTLAINWVRFGNPLHFGYDADNGWVIPTVKTWAGVLISPGRGILWEFPAIVLTPIGVLALFRSGRRREAITILSLVAVLLLSTSAWYMWWGGWCWGLRLFNPAVPLLAVLAGIGLDRIQPGLRRLAGGAVLLFGFVWALPGLLTDLLGGYGELGENVWALAAYPPYGAWQFVQRLRGESLEDMHSVDIVWFRLAHLTGNWSLLPPVLFLAVAVTLFVRARRSLEHAQ
jgi:hypothetical protein